jgi:glycosyltransferase involved in cell wall biosynthesis
VMRLGFISATLTFDALRMTAHQLCYWPALLLTYRRFLRNFAPDQIVHTNWHHLLLLAPFLKSSRDIYWVHEVLPDKPQFRKVFDWLARRLKCFVAVSNAVAESLYQIGIPRAKVRVIHNGIKDPSGFTKPKVDTYKQFRIAIVGQVGEWKGHDDLLDAFGAIQKKHSNSELHIFGRGAVEYERHLKERILCLGITEQVFWHGFISDRKVMFRGMAVCVAPSRSQDPLPTTASEAGFFGIPVIGTRRGGLPGDNRRWRHGTTF